jgi:hypothetical protein
MQLNVNNLLSLIYETSRPFSCQSCRTRSQWEHRRNRATLSLVRIRVETRGGCNGEAHRAGRPTRRWQVKHCTAPGAALPSYLAADRLDGSGDLGVGNGAERSPRLDLRAAQAVAADNLTLGWDVIADCVNYCQEARDGWEATAQRAGAEVKWLEVVCGDPSEHRRRIETRSSDIPGLALPDWHAVTLRAYDDWNHDRFVIDTAHRNLDACIDEAFELLRR